MDNPVPDNTFRKPFCRQTDFVFLPLDDTPQLLLYALVVFKHIP
jgi:hypothetical protein